MLLFLDPETVEILQFLDPEIMKIDQKICGSRKYRNAVISGSRNCRQTVVSGSNIFLDPEILKMVRFLGPDMAEIVDKSYIKYATMQRYKDACMQVFSYNTICIIKSIRRGLKLRPRFRHFRRSQPYHYMEIPQNKYTHIQPSDRHLQTLPL